MKEIEFASLRLPNSLKGAAESEADSLPLQNMLIVNLTQYLGKVAKAQPAKEEA